MVQVYLDFVKGLGIRNQEDMIGLGAASRYLYGAIASKP